MIVSFSPPLYIPFRVWVKPENTTQKLRCRNQRTAENPTQGRFSYLDGDGIKPTERQQFRKRTCCFSVFSAHDGGPQENLRAAVNTNEKRNHEICFITVS